MSGRKTLPVLLRKERTELVVLTARPDKSTVEVEVPVVLLNQHQKKALEFMALQRELETYYKEGS